MSRTIFVPDTNFFLDMPEFVSFFTSAPSLVHLVILWPVLRELDHHRSKRGLRSPHDRERGEKAYRAFQLIRNLQETPDPNLGLEVNRCAGINTQLDFDTQIVDCTIALADKYTDEEIVFVTSDEGLPTVLFREEKRHRKLGLLTLITTNQLKTRLASFGKPAVTVTRVEVNKDPMIRTKKQSCIELVLDLIAEDLRQRDIRLIVEYEPPKDISKKKVRTVVKKSRKIKVKESCQKIDNITVSIPHSKLNIARRKYGVQHVGLKLYVWDTDRDIALCSMQYDLSIASFGQHLSPQVTE